VHSKSVDFAGARAGAGAGERCYGPGPVRTSAECPDGRRKKGALPDSPAPSASTTHCRRPKQQSCLSELCKTLIFNFSIEPRLLPAFRRKQHTGQGSSSSPEQLPAWALQDAVVFSFLLSVFSAAMPKVQPAPAATVDSMHACWCDKCMPRPGVGDAARSESGKEHQTDDCQRCFHFLRAAALHGGSDGDCELRCANGMQTGVGGGTARHIFTHTHTHTFTHARYSLALSLSLPLSITHYSRDGADAATAPRTLGAWYDCRGPGGRDKLHFPAQCNSNRTAESTSLPPPNLERQVAVCHTRQRAWRAS